MNKILIIEDDVKIALALSVRLKAAGYEVKKAHDALTGFRAAVNDPPDLVLLDISMPAGDGFSVAEKIRSQLPGHTPIIFITASKLPEFRVRAAELSAIEFFEKPFEAGELLEAIRSALSPACV